MKRISILLSILMLLPALGCAVEAYSGEIKAHLGQQVELKPGQTVSIEEEHVKVKFIEVVNDSRCPEGATCIWAGKVSCIVEITYMGSIQRETLTQPILSQDSSSEFFKEYSIAFSVLPYPKLGIDIKPSKYRLQLVINKSAKFEDTEWFLRSYGEQGNLKEIIDGTEIKATFNSSEGQVGGSAGCNIYGGKYQIAGNTISISEIYSTEMACISPEGVMEQEQEFLTTLTSSQSFQVDDTTLTILCSGGQRLYFTKATS